MDPTQPWTNYFDKTHVFGDAFAALPEPPAAALASDAAPALETRKRKRASPGCADHEPRALKWIGSLFHPDLEQLVAADDATVRERLLTFGDWCARLVYQLERCPTTGRLHLQFFVRCKERMYRRQVQGAVTPIPGVHLDNEVFGGDASMIAYVTKELSRVRGPWSYGDESTDAMKPGKRTDLATACACLKESRSLKAVAETHPESFVRYHMGLKAWLDQTQAPRATTRPMALTCLWGPPGTGKTTLAHHLSMLLFSAQAYSPHHGPHMWDEYKGEKLLILDEFDWPKWDIHFFKKVIDKFILQLDCRYHNRFAEWEHVVICSNSSPTTWWTGPSVKDICADDIKAVFRRLGHGCRYKIGYGQVEDCANEPDFDPSTGDLIVPGF